MHDQLLLGSQEQEIVVMRPVLGSNRLLRPVQQRPPPLHQPHSEIGQTEVPCNDIRPIGVCPSVLQIVDGFPIVLN